MRGPPPRPGSIQGSSERLRVPPPAGASRRARYAVDRCAPARPSSPCSPPARRSTHAIRRSAARLP
jgi:hypothetical protein